jgi:hypothetical protein
MGVMFGSVVRRRCKKCIIIIPCVYDIVSIIIIIEGLQTNGMDFPTGT